MYKPYEFIDNYIIIAENKVKSPAWRLLLLGVLAGFFIGMGSAVTNTAAHAVENVSIAKILGGLLFPFGLIAVIITGAELFTSNCFIIQSVLSRQVRALSMVRNLVLVYVGNFIGAALLAASCTFGGQLSISHGGLAVYTIKVAIAKSTLSFESAVILGILCNILVCAGVMCSYCAKDIAGRALGAYGPICFFVLCGFEHCIANMYYIPAGLFALSIPEYAELAVAAGLHTSALTWNHFLFANLLPVTLGNLIGGMGFAALIWVTQYTQKPIQNNQTE